MNKEVIYLEPEDDITDILTKLQKAEQKLVALVPPKKAAMLRSAVNMKLIARTAKESEKIVVIVTADPAVIKLAMSARIPIAKTLQSRPVIPTPEMVQTAKSSEQVIDEDLADSEANSESDTNSAKNTSKNSENSAKNAANGSKMPSEASKNASEGASEKSAVTLELNDESLENASKKGDKSSKSNQKSAKSTKVPSLEKYRKWIIAGSVAALAVICFLVWAFVFAPAVKVVVAMETTSENFSETVNFTTELSAEKASEGLFYATKQSYEQKYSQKTSTTGEEDRGERASGEVTLTKTVELKDALNGLEISVKQGDQFVASNGLTYVAIAAKSVALNELYEDCQGTGMSYVCSLTLTVPIEASAPGESYNLNANSNWNSFSGMSVTNSKAISGGTSNIVKIVSQSDVDKVKDELVANHADEGKESLLSDLKTQDVVIIDASYASEVTSVDASPAVNEEATETTVSVTVVYSVYTVDRTKVQEYVAAKLALGDDQKIYSLGEPYFERFTGLENSARLKTVVSVGPVITEETILGKIKGIKIGEAQSVLKSINGVSTVEITPSYFWVRSVPDDPNKITIELKMEEE